MTGEQRHQIPAWLYKNFFNFVGFYDLDFHHLISKRLPQVADCHLISHFQLLYVPEKQRSIPAPMPGQDAIGVAPANGHGGLGQLSCSGSQVLAVAPR